MWFSGLWPPALSPVLPSRTFRSNPSGGGFHGQAEDIPPAAESSSGEAADEEEAKPEKEEEKIAQTAILSLYFLR
jgi:hypothetical protein